MGNRAFSAIKADSSPDILSAGAQTSNDGQKPEEKKLSPCCVCKETKRERDSCIIENGEENCTSLIEAHKECMRKMGFNI